jgi:putative two-component system response regulator
MKILIADDDDIIVEILKTALQSAGYQTETACDGHDALDRITHDDIRMVVTDWEMPRMDGLALCRAIRQRSSDGYTYVILVTSRGSSHEIVEGMAAGADDFVVKPFNKAELLARVRAGERVLALESHEMVIFSLAKLAESRDPETGHHLERVRRYSRRLAEALAERASATHPIDADFIRLVFKTSPLHDIGKVGIPDAILLKPGRLTDDEFEVMKGHTTIGAETLDAALANYPHAKFLQVARDIAMSHHERWDGAGYPQGLAGEDIPLAARIVSVADVYDALTSKRVYKVAYSDDVATNVITAESGQQFDPDVVAAFLAVRSDFIEIRASLQDAAAETALTT